MASPFPGMDPFLEHPALWPDVHNRLIAALGESLEERTYLAEPEGLLFVGVPDPTVTGEKPIGASGPSEPSPAGRAIAVEVPVPARVRETFLEVRVPPGGEVVTVIELLSPTNKVSGAGRRLYEEKRASVLASRTSLVEIDLLRIGEPMAVLGTDRTGDYRILVSRGDRRPQASLHVFGVRDPIPRFGLPLRPGDEEPEIDLGATLARVYQSAAYDLRVDYAGEAVPPLSEQDRAWARTLSR